MSILACNEVIRQNLAAAPAWPHGGQYMMMDNLRHANAYGFAGGIVLP